MQLPTPLRVGKAMMNVADYLTEIEYAAQNIIPLIWAERERLKELEAQIAPLRKVIEHNYQQSESWQLNAEDPDDVAMGAGIYWGTYFGEDKELFYKDKDREKLVDQIAAHRISVDSLAGSLLEYAKKGISLAHGGLAACPAGRAIGTQRLKTIIWQARNQSTHWEEAKANNGVFKNAEIKKCFDKLSIDVDARFADYTERDMAFDVIEQLGWKDFTIFKAEMMSLS